MQGIANAITALQGGRTGDQNAPPDQQPSIPTYDPLTHAVMLGSAQMASDAAKQKAVNAEAEKQVSGKPMEITAKVDPSGDASYTFKNVKPGPNLDKIHEAIMAPHKDAAEGVGEMQLGTALQGIQKVLNSITKPGEDVFHDDATKYRGGYRASRELGANPMQALIDGIRVAVGGISKESVQKQVDAHRGAQQASVVKQFMPVIQGAMGERRLDNEETRIANTESKTATADALKTINDTDFSQVEPGERYRQIADQLGVPVEDLSAGMRGRIDRKARQDDRKRNDAEFEAFRKDKNALGTFESFGDVKQSFGRPMKTEQESQLSADYKAARNDYELKQKNERLKVEAADRAAKKLDINIQTNPLVGPDDEVNKHLDFLIDSENQGKDISKVSAATYGKMVQRRADRSAHGDAAAALPDKYSVATQKTLAESSQVLDEATRLKAMIQREIKANPDLAKLPLDKALANIAYKAGFSSGDEFNQHIAELSILGLKSAATVGAKGVRNWKYINLTLGHTADPGKDSLQLMVDKLGAIQSVNEDTISANKKFGLKSGVVAPGKATHRYNKATGKIEAIQQ